MTPLIVATALSLLALDAAPANTAPTAVPPAKVTGASKTDALDDLDKVICKDQPITGSRFNKRLCMTRRDWDEHQRQLEQFERQVNETPNAATSQGMR